MRRLLLALTLAVAAPASAEPPQTHEIIYTRPSGFWTSNQPAPPGYQYKWRLMEIGAVVGLLTGWLLVRSLKKASAYRGEHATLPAARTENH
jgi:hypothetical protein